MVRSKYGIRETDAITLVDDEVRFGWTPAVHFDGIWGRRSAAEVLAAVPGPSQWHILGAGRGDRGFQLAELLAGLLQ